MAAFTQALSNFTNSSDANFRAWGSYISARLDAVGLIKTADTGQIDWTTVLTPPVTNAFQGYEIRRFADSLQATAPVFFKIEYGESGSIDTPSVKVTFGSGSNGSGALTGNLSTTYFASNQPVAGACSVFGSGDTNRFCIIIGMTTAGGYGMFFGFERSKNAAGQDTIEAVLGVFNNVTSSGGPTGLKFYPVWSTSLGDLGGVAQSVAPAIFPIGNTGLSGSQVIVCPILHSKGVFMNPGLNFLGYYTANIAPNSTPSIYMYGVLHTYYAIPETSAIGSTGFQGPGGGTEALAMRYE